MQPICRKQHARRQRDGDHKAGYTARCDPSSHGDNRLAIATSWHNEANHYTNRTMKHISLVVALIIIAFAKDANAQSYLSPNPPAHSVDDRFRLEVDLLHSGYDTQVRLDPTAQTPGTEISAEDDLGLDSSSTTLQVELTLLPGKHHMVRLQGLSMRREGSAILTKNILWDNNLYLAGERADSHLNVSMIGLTYGWLPFRKDRYELGVTFGIQIAAVDANAEVRARVVRPADNGVAPIPVVGLEGRFDFTRRWSVGGRFQYLTVNAEDVDGTLTDARLALRWRQNQHLIYGLGYRYFNLDIVSANTNTPGLVHLSMTGPMLFVQGSL